MEHLPSEIIDQIASYMSISELRCLSQTSKYINQVCQYRWKRLFNEIFPYLFITTNNYNSLFMKYYKLFSSDNPLLEADDNTIKELNYLGLDSIRLRNKSYNIKSDNIALLFNDYPYSSRQIESVLEELICDIGDKLPDIKSGNLFPTGLYIVNMLNKKEESINKLSKTLDRCCLIKHIALRVKTYLDPSKLNYLVKIINPTFDELVECLGEIIDIHNYKDLKRVFNLNNTDILKLAIYQLNIEIIKDIKIKGCRIKDPFCRSVLDIIHGTNDNIKYVINKDINELYTQLKVKQETYSDIIRKIVYKLSQREELLNYLYRAAVWRIILRRGTFLNKPFRLEDSYKIFKYLTSGLDFSDIIDNYSLFEIVIRLNGSNKTKLLEQIYSKPELIPKAENIIKLYGPFLGLSKINLETFNRMDIITRLPLNNNFHNIFTYIDRCINEKIHNDIFDKLLKRPECIGILLKSWPKSKPYIDKLNITDKRIAYKAARRSVNLFNMLNLTNYDGLEYLLDKLIPKRDVDRYLLRSFNENYVKYFPNRKINIEDIIFDAKAVQYFPLNYIDNVDRIIDKYINIYPLSCEILINIINKNYIYYEEILSNNPRYKINKIVNNMLSAELYRGDKEDDIKYKSSTIQADLWFLLHTLLISIEGIERRFNVEKK